MHGRTLISLAICLCCMHAASAERRLNSLVVELVNEPTAADATQEFTLPRDAWVFIRANPGAGASLTLDSAPLELSKVGAASEAMRHLAAGKHQLQTMGKVDSLIVRRIPEIRFANYPADPWVHRFGPYDRAFLSKHIFPHITTLVADATMDLQPEAEAWRNSGRQWFVEAQAPGLHDPEKPLEPATVLSEIRKIAGLDREWIDGAMLDEYYPSLKAIFPPTLVALQRQKDDPILKHKFLQPYVAGKPEEMADFVKHCIDMGHLVALERYNCEQPTEEAARQYLRERLVDYVGVYAEKMPMVQHRLMIALGFMSGPPETLNTNQSVNYRVFQDREFNLLANDPRFEDLGGVMLYTVAYAEEETVRWSGQLLRHYCIEGSRTPLSDEPYALTHLENPDFETGLAGWTVRAASDGSIAARTVENLGDKQGRFGAGRSGDTCAVLTRSEKAPNTLSQTIRNLVPGKTYVLRIYSTSLREGLSSYGNPSFDDITRLSTRIDGAQVDDRRSFDHLYRSIHTPKLMYFNYHFRIFKALAETATLTLSDWQSPENRGGNVGRTTAINFVEVAPYYEDTQANP
jgi:hypothetical protein